MKENNNSNNNNGNNIITLEKSYGLFLASTRQVFRRVFKSHSRITFTSRNSLKRFALVRPNQGCQFRDSKVQFYFDFIFPFSVHVWIYKQRKQNTAVHAEMRAWPYFEL